ncbi:glucokinase [Roseovarius rhodophyticola]|uniref:Glucokinase n=1 Tax=Roseovarius rhodophyticola TaxID=3080827 RepID=A0ABZ2TNK1_9RHOB|nr:glucokinase [Roseovarius sp. W115]MDV2929701.1 glucokinase [Roseovarius sp. W115]
MAEHLLIDLGGTHCRVGLALQNKLDPETVQRFAIDPFEDLSQLLQTYLADKPRGRIHAICAGVAGPVRDGSAQLTNHNWFIDATTLQRSTGIPDIHLLNDLQAQAYALDDLHEDALQTLVKGMPEPGGPRLVLGLGTGCNIAVAHQQKDRVFVPASESGHTTLPDAPGFRPLFDALYKQAGHLPIEAALSGSGLTRIHAFFSGETLTPSQIIAAQPRKTLQCFVSLLGLVASNLCLSHMATGGLYLIGGTARAIAPFLKPMGFTDTFHPRGPYTDILKRIPVTVIHDDNAALLGCARYLSQKE